MCTKNTSETKPCTKCGRILPVTNFWRQHHRKDGLDSRCKDCKNSEQRARINEQKKFFTCASCGGPRLSRRSTLCRPCSDIASRGVPHSKEHQPQPYLRRPKAPRELIDNRDGTHSVPLTKGQFALIDSADTHLVSGNSWCASGVGEKLYAMAFVNGKGLLMHRRIIDAVPGDLVDHINGDRLDNRRCNLRICTNSQNMANRNGLPSNNSTGYLGVYPFKKTSRFFGRVNHKGNAFFTKPFDTVEEAAKERDRLAKNIFGEFARLNFPDEDAA